MIPKAARIIVGGGVVVYPTETVYGLGANALDEQAVLRVFQIKKRSLDKPLLLAVSSLNMLEKVAFLGDDDLALLDKILPGPISVLVRKRPLVPDVLTSGSPLVGIRFPDHEIAQEIIDLSGPITSTSANRSGEPSPVRAEDVSPDIRSRVDFIIDGGESRYCQPSTLIDLERRTIIRAGAGLDKALKAIS